MVAMSGGVDSSVAALLCVRQGYDVIGATMQVWPEAAPEVELREGGCCSLSAVTDARRVAQKLGIPHYVLNFRQEFEEAVIRQFISEYSSGRTPNPCIVCNKVVKFENLMNRARQLDCDYLATGHYARIEREPAGRYALLRALHDDKDQSYALYSLNQEQLKHTLFPCGDYKKAEIREIASLAGLPTSQKADSQDICFVVEGSYSDFLSQRDPGLFLPGVVVDTSGRVLGRHDGIANFTVGQRKGLGIALGKPMYVIAIRPEERTVVVGSWDESLGSRLTARECNWIREVPEEQPLRCEVKIRYKASAVKALVTRHGTSASVILDEPQRAITPGQAAVFYDGDVVIGGGTIVSD
jgi:tRNA-uridine 2-sulfurtransferase